MVSVRDSLIYTTGGLRQDCRVPNAEHTTALARTAKLGRYLGSCGGSAALLEALTAEDRPALGGLERDRGFLAASRATGAGFNLVVSGSSAARGYAQRALPL